MNDFDSALLSGSEFVLKSKRAVLSRVGRLLAVLTFIAVGIVTFTDVVLSDISATATLIDLVLYLLGASTIFFSLEKDGETSACEEKEYSAQKRKFQGLTEKITGEMLEDLRVFADNFSKNEYEHRLSVALTRLGVTPSEYQRFLKGEKLPRDTRRACRKIKAVKPYVLSAGALLSASEAGDKSELINPAGDKFRKLLQKLLPSLVFMSMTVAIAIQVKDGLTPDMIVGGIFRLSALLSVGAKGYLFGFRYVSEDLTLWLGTKIKLLESFLNQRG